MSAATATATATAISSGSGTGSGTGTGTREAICHVVYQRASPCHRITPHVLQKAVRAEVRRGVGVRDSDEQRQA